MSSYSFIFCIKFILFPLVLVFISTNIFSHISWHNKICPPHTINSKSVRSKIILKNVIAQSVADRVTDNSGHIVGYHLSFDHQISMEFEEYQQLGLNMDNIDKGKSMAEQENRFWREIALRTNDVSKAPLYAIDNEIVLFARGQTNCWDLSKLTSSDSLIHQVQLLSLLSFYLQYFFLHFPFYLSLRSIWFPEFTRRLHMLDTLAHLFVFTRKTAICVPWTIIMKESRNFGMVCQTAKRINCTAWFKKSPRNWT